MIIKLFNYGSSPWFFFFFFFFFFLFFFLSAKVNSFMRP